MSDREVLYVNGRWVVPEEARLSPLDRGFTLADGVFETMVARGGDVFRLSDHLERLRQGASLLEIPLPAQEQLSAAILETLRRNDLPRSVVRLTLTRGVDTGRGLAVAGDASPTVVIRVTPHRAPETLPPGLRVVVAAARRNEASPLSRVKSLGYTEGVLARLEAHRAGADDAVFLNTAGRLACGTSSNLFLVQDGVLLTPPIEEGALPGIARRTILELAVALGFSVVEQPLPSKALESAQEAFVTNVVTGPIPVVAVAGYPLSGGRAGPSTERLWRAYGDRAGY